MATQLAAQGLVLHLGSHSLPQLGECPGPPKAVLWLFGQGLAVHSRQAGAGARHVVPHDPVRSLGRSFPVTCILGPCTYDVKCGPCPTQWRVIPVNHLKGWVETPQTNAPVLAELVVDPKMEGGGWDRTPTTPMAQLPFGETLSHVQRAQLARLLETFPLSNPWPHVGHAPRD